MCIWRKLSSFNYYQIIIKVLLKLSQIEMKHTEILYLENSLANTADTCVMHSICVEILIEFEVYLRTSILLFTVNKSVFVAIQDMFVKHDQDALRTANTGHDPCRLAHLAGNRPVHGAAQIYSQPAQHHQGPFHRQASYSLSDDDEDDDLPLPPPPEELISSPSEHRLGAPNYAGNVHRKLSCTLPRNAPAVQNLPGVLALRSSARRESECSRISNWSDKSSGLSSSLEVEENAEHSLSRQLKSVKLKRAESYDRSSPRILKQ